MQNFKIVALLLLGYFWFIEVEGGIVDNTGFPSHRCGFSWGLWLRLTKIFFTITKMVAEFKK
jgi:hypothetical protein